MQHLPIVKVKLTIPLTKVILQEQGFDIIERFGHIHATKDGCEWHICLVADLTWMNETDFQEALESSFRQSLASIARPFSMEPYS